MRLLFLLLALIIVTGAIAQDRPSTNEKSTGSTVLQKPGEQMQPQGPTGPIHTGSGGAPAESPQGQTPPGMQAAPEGSGKTIIDEEKKK